MALGLLVTAFVAFSLPPYLTFDPARSRVPIAMNSGAYYPMLVAHVVFGSVAIMAGCLQVWPWLRRRRPSLHRKVGTAYVFCGVLPAGALGLVVGIQSPFGPVLAASNVLLATVWLTVTTMGYRAVRARRMTTHRRWMIRSVVLTLSVITNRVWAVVWVLVLSPQLDTTFHGNEAAMVQAIAALSGWLGWVVPLLVAEWWLEGHRAAPGASEVQVGAA